MNGDELETEVSVLKMQVLELLSRIDALGDKAGAGFLNAPAPGQVLTEPKPITAFDVRKVGDAWKMYYPSGCLLCDGVAATGITPGADGYAAVSGSNIGIGITWTKNKVTKAVSNVVATINQTMTATLTVTEGTDSYTIAANFPVATIADNEVRQITSGFVSLTSDTGDAGGGGAGVDNVSIEEYGEEDSDSGSEADPVHAIKGWHTAQASTANLGSLITAEEEDIGRHILVRNGNNNAPEFLPIGRITIPSAANDGKLKVKFGSGTASQEVEKFSANQSTDSTIEFAKVAETGSYNDLTDTPTIPEIPDITVDASGVGSGQAIGGLSVSTSDGHKLIATGVNIPTPLSGNLSFIGDVRYDISTHQIQKRVDTLNLATGAITTGTFTMITGGQAVPHPDYSEGA